MTDRNLTDADEALEERMMTKFWRWLAWKLPRPLVYFAAIRLGAAATTGKHGHTVVPEMRFMDAIGRWEDDRHNP